MSENEITERRWARSPTTAPQKRGPPFSSEENSRSKRAKYTTNACDACKKSKLKCSRHEGERDCERCMKMGRSCIYARYPAPYHISESTGTSANPIIHAGQSQSGEQSSIGILVTPSPSSAAFCTGDEEAVPLRTQVESLGMQLKELSRKLDLLSSSSTITNTNQPSRQHYPATTNSRQHEPQQPLFVGHTRSAFNLDVAKTSLSKMGISPDAIDPISGLASLAPSPREPSPESDPHTNLTPDPLPAKDPLLTIALPEVCRLLAVFHEEIESLYPFVNSDTLVTVARTKTERLAMQMGFMGSDLSEDRDINILKIAVAIAVVVEAKGRNSLSSKLVDSTDKRAAQVTRSLDVDLRDLQWLTLLSIYYFQIDEDLLAWRTIGNAARMALEMGLHRRRSLTDNYKSADDQAKATRIFWCVYVLDRRWSFGTGLSFALNDRDIDPELPEPGDDYAHLRCMIGYGRLCTKVWDALPPYGSPTSTIPLDQVQYLEFLIRNWLDSIPAHLQFNHPRLGLASRNQPRILRRLCAFLYLRGNHLRTLVYRHHVLSPSFVHANLHSARLVVDIAKDSIQVLVDLAETSDIYARQQAAFNYFLLSALAVILLAVCNAPRTFSNSCYESFSSAVELVRKFSRGSLASRRLWNSIRGLLPAIRTLGLKIGSETTNTQYEGPSNVPRDTPDQNQEVPHPPPVDKSIPQVMPLMLPPEGTTTIPNTFQMGDDLMGLFNAFGQADAETIIFDDPLPSLDSNYMQMTFPMEISRRFQGLI